MKARACLPYTLVNKLIPLLPAYTLLSTHGLPVLDYTVLIKILGSYLANSLTVQLISTCTINHAY